MFSNSLKNAFGIEFRKANMTIWKNVKKCNIEGSSLNLNKDRSGRSRKEHNTKTLIFFKKSISARKNGFDTSKKDARYIDGNRN